MNKLYRIAAMLPMLLLINCGDDPKEFTWGDAVTELSTAYCQASADCGYFTEPDQQRACVDHSVFHLCTLPGTCELVAKATLEPLVDACVDELANNANCVALYWGLVPPSCGEVLRGAPDDAE